MSPTRARDAAAADADADDTTLATTAVNSEGDDFATHVEERPSHPGAALATPDAKTLHRDARRRQF